MGIGRRNREKARRAVPRGGMAGLSSARRSCIVVRLPCISGMSRDGAAVSGYQRPKNTRRNLPIMSSSPLFSCAESTRLRFTYVPLRLPTSSML